MDCPNQLCRDHVAAGLSATPLFRALRGFAWVALGFTAAYLKEAGAYPSP